MQISNVVLPGPLAATLIYCRATGGGSGGTLRQLLVQFQGSKVHPSASKCATSWSFDRRRCPDSAVWNSLSTAVSTELIALINLLLSSIFGSRWMAHRIGRRTAEATARPVVAPTV